MSTLRIAFVGDVCLGASPDMALHEDVQAELRRADLLIVNQEGAITTAPATHEDKLHLVSGVAAAGVLKSWGVHVATLANNHMFDSGFDGFRETTHLLDAAGIAWLGAGETLAEASRPLVLTRSGLRIGLLAYSWDQIETTCATDAAYGCAPLDRDLMLRQVRELRQRVDAVLVLPHWGYCEYAYPLPDQVELAAELIDAGASAIVGHHAHVLHGYVAPPQRYVAYSLGNFALADWTHRGAAVKQTRENLEGVILTLSLGRTGVTGADWFFTRRDGRLIVPDNTPARRADLARRCAPLARPDYARHWRRYVRYRMLQRVAYWADLRNWRKLRKQTLLGGWIMLRNALRGRLG